VSAHEPDFRDIPCRQEPRAAFTDRRDVNAEGVLSASGRPVVTRGHGEAHQTPVMESTDPVKLRSATRVAASIRARAEGLDSRGRVVRIDREGPGLPSG